MYLLQLSHELASGITAVIIFIKCRIPVLFNFYMHGSLKKRIVSLLVRASALNVSIGSRGC